MADVKWIKIATDIFNNKKIRVIEAMPEGDSIIVIWFKLLALAGTVNDEGYVYFTKELPYTDQMLATIFDRPLTVIQLALNTFNKFGMIEIIDDIIHVSNWEKYQNVEGMERIKEQTRKRVAKYREQKKLEMTSQYCAYCGNAATGYDHIIATSKGGDDSESNKVPCCIECNRIKNDKPLIDFLNNNRDRINDELVTGNPKLSRYVTLCNVTHRYNVTQCNATDIDIDKDIDTDKDNNTPLTPLGEWDAEKHTNVQNYDHLVETEMNEVKNTQLLNTVREWLAYKDGRKPKASNHYQLQSIRTLTNKVFENAKAYGTDAVIAVINESMANNYSGITWNELLKRGNPKQSNRYSFMDD